MLMASEMLQKPILADKIARFTSIFDIQSWLDCTF